MTLALVPASAAKKEPVQPHAKIQPTEVVYLYPEGQDAEFTTAGSAVMNNGITEPETINGQGFIFNIADKARVEIYLPKKCNGQMVVVCPGGGYMFSSSYNEGCNAAEWFVKNNIAVAVVEYRMPNGHSMVPVTDVQNAFRYCRSRAGEWGVKQIGVMGFSAGGHLAASASNLYTDSITHPDFSILIYPVITMENYTHKGSRENLLGNPVSAEDVALWSMEKRVTPNTPVTFLALSQDDDTVPIENSINYYMACKNAGVKAEMHIYPAGGHGWGFNRQAYQFKGSKDGFAQWRASYEAELLRFLKEVLK